jgi:hypothetical protein
VAAGEEPASLKALKGKRVAVTVFAQTTNATPYARSAQARLEEALGDNDIKVLDEAKTRELRDVCKTLEDPAAFITAETFIENAKKFEMEGVLGVYLSTEVVPGPADCFSATAHVDLRFIGSEDARVASFATSPMGTRGSPSSEGVTPDSATINAVQRAIDSACTLTGLRLTELTRPKSVDLGLAEPTRTEAAGFVFAAPAKDPTLAKMPLLEKQHWRVEEVTCTATAPAGGLAAVAGYISDTTSSGGMGPGALRRLYGSRIHLVDTIAGKTLLSFVCSPVEASTREEPNTKRVLHCAFVGGWRYLCAATGNHVLLWDTEKGVEISRRVVPGEPTGLAIEAGPAGNAVIIRTKRGNWRYGIVRARPAGGGDGSQTSL